MIYLILSVSASAGILIVFRLFKSLNINTKQAIVFNYISAACVGLISYKHPLSVRSITTADWLVGAAGLGLLFICIFNLMAVTAQYQGLSVVSVASKMSVIIPIGMGVIIYQEVLSALQAAGILLALISVYLVSVKTDHPIKVKTSFLLPSMVFLGSGIIDSALKYFENF